MRRKDTLRVNAIYPFFPSIMHLHYNQFFEDDNVDPFFVYEDDQKVQLNEEVVFFSEKEDVFYISSEELKEMFSRFKDFSSSDRPNKKLCTVEIRAKTISSSSLYLLNEEKKVKSLTFKLIKDEIFKHSNKQTLSQLIKKAFENNKVPEEEIESYMISLLLYSEANFGKEAVGHMFRIELVFVSKAVF